MPEFNLIAHSNNQSAVEAESSSTIYNLLLLMTGFTIAIYAFAKYAESKNQLNLDSRLARIISGVLVLWMNLLHTKESDLFLTNPEHTLITVGPHNTGFDGFVVASKIKAQGSQKATAPRALATTDFDKIPGVGAFMRMFKAIPVEANAHKEKGQTANAGAIQSASKVLEENGCVILFPQGNLSKIGQPPHKIYAGAAKIAIQSKTPITVIRLDGFWCLENPFIPVVIRNSSTYRIFLSLFHINNVRATLCHAIDFHLKPENAALSDEQKVDELCAQLYAYYRDTRTLSSAEIAKIPQLIASGKHQEIWKNKLKQGSLEKELATLRAKEDEAFDTLRISPTAY